ncbi:putative ferric-chelate reductase 1 homolog isoform X2 [Ruditapes philippinarum]|uniref:putative ferric-chelate reductase 1 homolog isoform X2 n=1 Tax=Ruditapes philippinarum TaxID=129788 RepID=UPI00295B482D|nr:putative ferric-chelate reductase 1 homolog isoform X2 [Ruditapes philippinarum]
MSIYETTPSVSDSGRSFDTVDNVQQFTVGQYVNVNHRTKASDSNMPETTHRDLSPFDKGFENLDQKEANDTFESLNVPTSQFNELNLNSINQNNSDQINELPRWTDNYNRINWTRTDLNDNYENASLDEPHTTTNHGLGNNLKDTWSQSLRITELPLSDPNRIFKVAKEILLKDRNHVVTFRELIKPLDFSGNKLTLNDVKTDDKANSFPQNSYQFTTETAEKTQDINIPTAPFIPETTPVSVTNRPLLDIVTEDNNSDNNRKVKDPHNDSVKETKLPEIDITTTQSSVTIESGSRSTTLKEIVSKWMREHVHDVPDPVSTSASNEPDKSKINDEQSSNQNDTNTFKHLDSRYPKLEGGKIQYDPQCGVVKGCFVDCSGNDCKFMVTWRDLGTAVQFELFGKPDRSFNDAWVAVGFSSDTRMGDDSVTECVYSNGFIQGFSSYNTGYSNPRRLNPPKVGLINVDGYYNDGVLFCSFIRQKSLPQIQGFFDLEQDWHIMFAHGKVLQVPAWQLYMHSTTDLPPASAARIDYQSVVVIGSAAKFPLVKAHGCLMIIGWVLFTGIGLVVARYYKSVWGDKTFMKLKIWFQVHRACMVTAVGLNIIAFILIFIEVKGYSDIPDIPGKGYLRSHPVLGIIVTVLCVANPVMALFRPGPDSNKRPIFNWAHWGVGMTAYILSAICICFGFQLGKSSTPDYAIYIMIVYVLYIIIFDVVFEVMELLNKKEKKVKVEGMEMSNRNGTENGTIPNGNHVTKDKIRKSDKIKTMLLALHIAFTGAFALVLVLVVALN